MGQTGLRASGSGMLRFVFSVPGTPSSCKPCSQPAADQPIEPLHLLTQQREVQ